MSSGGRRRYYMGPREWLLTETPWSRAQAQLGQAYRGMLAFVRNPVAVIGAAIVTLLVLTALLAPLLAPSAPDAQDLTLRLRPPGGAWLFGTDELGRDIFSRILYGARITLGIVALVVVLVGPVGLLVGCTAGYVGGWLDVVLMRTTDVFLAFPRPLTARPATRDRAAAPAAPRPGGRPRAAPPATLSYRDGSRCAARRQRSSRRFARHTSRRRGRRTRRRG